MRAWSRKCDAGRARRQRQMIYSQSHVIVRSWLMKCVCHSNSLKYIKMYMMWKRFTHLMITTIALKYFDLNLSLSITLRLFFVASHCICSRRQTYRTMLAMMHTTFPNCVAKLAWARAGTPLLNSAVSVSNGCREKRQIIYLCHVWNTASNVDCSAYVLARPSFPSPNPGPEDLEKVSGDNMGHYSVRHS